MILCSQAMDMLDHVGIYIYTYYHDLQWTNPNCSVFKSHRKMYQLLLQWPQSHNFFGDLPHLRWCVSPKLSRRKVEMLQHYMYIYSRPPSKIEHQNPIEDITQSSCGLLKHIIPYYTILWHIIPYYDILWHIMPYITIY